MNVIDRPLTSGGIRKNHPKLIVVHAMAEYVKDPKPIYAPVFLEQYKLSAHALIAPNGDVIRCREDYQRASHARGFNTDSLGVEFLMPGNHDYASFIASLQTDWVMQDQFMAGIELVYSWCQKYNISNEHVKRHSDISPGRKVDPGGGFKWNSFISAISAQVLEW